MMPVKGGRFWVGSEPHEGSSEERPRFETQVASFCLDRTEVTMAAYDKCAATGSCQPPRKKRRFCNANYPDRKNHPVNCVNWQDAVTYCEAQGARLPTEVEWEYAARGGSQHLKYSWGNESPNGRTCWKHPHGSCEVAQFQPGAFGLHDMIGNVWEWTASSFGPYPWPPVDGPQKVYRGGSWSRRFEKWMRPRLRNRYRAGDWGSHLGFRCAKTLDVAACPYGKAKDGGCLHGVETMGCSARKTFNGVRCAREGAPECPAGRKKVPGHGCVTALDISSAGPAASGSASKPAAISRARTPEFDADCAQHYPGRPQAFRYSGGTHAGRNQVSARVGCANRDVGVGWNSTCCP